MLSLLLGIVQAKGCPAHPEYELSDVLFRSCGYFSIPEIDPHAMYTHYQQHYVCLGAQNYYNGYSRPVKDPRYYDTVYMYSGYIDAEKLCNVSCPKCHDYCSKYSNQQEYKACYSGAEDSSLKCSDFYEGTNLEACIDGQNNGNQKTIEEYCSKYSSQQYKSCVVGGKNGIECSSLYTDENLKSCEDGKKYASTIKNEANDEENLYFRPISGRKYRITRNPLSGKPRLVFKKK